MKRLNVLRDAFKRLTFRRKEMIGGSWRLLSRKLTPNARVGLI